MAKTKRPRASINAPTRRAPLMSTGGQWLTAWQKLNQGQFDPSHSTADVQALVPEYDPTAGGDPAWIAAMLRQRQGSGAGGAGAPGAGDPSAPGELPQYAESSNLAALRAMAAKTDAGIEVNRKHDLDRVGYLSGLGSGADANNRFSQFNLLNRAFGREITGLNTGAAAAGQLHSGAYQEDVKDAGFDRSQGQYGLEQSNLDQTEGINRGAADQSAANAAQLQGYINTDRDQWLNTIRSMGASS